MLPPEAIAEYKKLYFQKFGIELDDETATDLANKLVQLYRVVLERTHN
jgi:uncharacterized membrane protein